MSAVASSGTDLGFGAGVLKMIDRIFLNFVFIIILLLFFVVVEGVGNLRELFGQVSRKVGGFFSLLHEHGVSNSENVALFLSLNWRV